LPAGLSSAWPAASRQPWRPAGWPAAWRARFLLGRGDRVHRRPARRRQQELATHRHSPTVARTSASGESSHRSPGPPRPTNRSIDPCGRRTVASVLRVRRSEREALASARPIEPRPSGSGHGGRRNHRTPPRRRTTTAYTAIHRQQADRAHLCHAMSGFLPTVAGQRQHRHQHRTITTSESAQHQPERHRGQPAPGRR